MINAVGKKILVCQQFSGFLMTGTILRIFLNVKHPLARQ